MNPQPVFTDKAPKPIGPYSQAMLSGDLLFLSGQIALDPVSGEMVGTTVEEQTRRALENMNAILIAQKCDFGSLIKVTIYLISMADFTVVNRVYQDVLSQAKPARSVVEVARLPRGALIEIEGVAQR